MSGLETGPTGEELAAGQQSIKRGPLTVVETPSGLAMAAVRRTSVPVGRHVPEYGIRRSESRRLTVVSSIGGSVLTLEDHGDEWNVGLFGRRYPVTHGCHLQCRRVVMAQDGVSEYLRDTLDSQIESLYPDLSHRLREGEPLHQLMRGMLTSEPEQDVFNPENTGSFRLARKVLETHRLISPAACEAFEIPYDPGP